MPTSVNREKSQRKPILQPKEQERGSLAREITVIMTARLYTNTTENTVTPYTKVLQKV
jgi:hypothetical protein